LKQERFYLLPDQSQQPVPARSRAFDRLSLILRAFPAKNSLARCPVRKPDLENVDEVPQITAQQAETAIPVIVPPDRNLLNTVTKALSQGEDLDVKHIAVDFLPPKEFQGSFAVEELEAALSINDPRQADNGLHKHAEAFGPNAAIKGLLAFNAGLL
jgi:hypothetical protein